MIESIPKEVLVDCAQLVKANSIQGELICGYWGEGGGCRVCADKVLLLWLAISEWNGRMGNVCSMCWWVKGVLVWWM